MSSIPTECPLCGQPVDPARWSPTSGSEIVATCSAAFFPPPGADACPWEDRFPYICAHCGSHRLVDVEPQHDVRGGLTVVTLGQVCADCGHPVVMS